MAAVISRYGVRSLILTGNDPCPDQSSAVCKELLGGARTTLGKHRLHRVGARRGVVVFRIDA